MFEKNFSLYLEMGTRDVLHLFTVLIRGLASAHAHYFEYIYDGICDRVVEIHFNATTDKNIYFRFYARIKTPEINYASYAFRPNSINCYVSINVNERKKTRRPRNCSSFNFK